MSELFQPFVPEPPEPKKRLFKPVPLRLVIPNAITLFSLCLGLTAIRFGYEGRLEHAVWAIVIAAVLDGIDGRVARMLKGTSRFGVELDSLADFINFGVAPSLILYNFSLKELGGFGWVAAMIYTIALVLRLARFNVMVDDPNRPEWKKDFFSGIPAPACALTSMVPIYLHLLGVPMEGKTLAILQAVYVFAIALLAVSTVPVYSGKTIGKNIPRQVVLPILLVLVACFALMINFRIEALLVIAIAYLAAIPLSVIRYRVLERQYAGEEVDNAADAMPKPEEPSVSG